MIITFVIIILLLLQVALWQLPKPKRSIAFTCSVTVSADSGADGRISNLSKQMFAALDKTGNGTVSSTFFTSLLKREGLLPEDPRLTGLFEYLRSVGGIHNDRALALNEFDNAISSCRMLVYNCVTGCLKVPNFAQFSTIFGEIFATVEPNKGGENASYIPQLAEVNPDQFAISVTTVDGQHFSIGDSQESFCVQSCSKPISYLIALTLSGAKHVHHHVGTEPSGRGVCMYKCV